MQGMRCKDRFAHMRLRFSIGFAMMVMVTGIPVTSISAQAALTLERCLELAVDNNLQVKQSQNSVHSAEIAYLQKKFDFLPAVSVNVPVNKSFGNSADIYTQQIAKSPWTSNPSLVASVVAFRGFSKWNDLKDAEYSLSASQYSLEDLKNDIRLNATLAFFQVMFATDNLTIGQSRMELLEKQLLNVQKQMEAGSKTQGDVYTVQAQVAAERVTLVTLQNTYDRSLLDLVLTLNLDPSTVYAVVKPPILEEGVENLEDLNAVYQAARLCDPGIRQQEFRELAARYALRSAQAAYLPTLNVGFGLGSFYSSNRKNPIGYTVVDGFPAIVYGEPIPMWTQFSDNFSQTMALTLTVPIFNRYLSRQGVLTAKLNQQNAALNLKAGEMELYRAIQTAYLDAKASDAKYAATLTQLESLGEALRYAQARYDAGLLDFLNYREVLDNHTKAEIELVQARYDRILKRKILDLYQGKPLRF